MVNCSANNCTNRSGQYPNKEVTFHKLPKDKVMREKWLNSVRRAGKLPKDVSFYVCSVHFEEDCYERDLQVIEPYSLLLFFC